MFIIALLDLEKFLMMKLLPHDPIQQCLVVIMNWVTSDNLVSLTTTITITACPPAIAITITDIDSDGDGTMHYTFHHLPPLPHTSNLKPLPPATALTTPHYNCLYIMTCHLPPSCPNMLPPYNSGSDTAFTSPGLDNTPHCHVTIAQLSPRHTLLSHTTTLCCAIDIDNRFTVATAISTHQCPVPMATRSALTVTVFTCHVTLCASKPQLTPTSNHRYMASLTANAPEDGIHDIWRRLTGKPKPSPNQQLSTLTNVQ